MIYFVTTKEHAYTHKSLIEQGFSNKVGFCSYNRFFKMQDEKAQPRAGTYIFTDMDRLTPIELRRSARIFGYLGRNRRKYRLFNNPLLVENRYALLRKLHVEGINTFNIYRADEFRRPVNFPVFIRSELGHDKPLSGLLSSQDELDTSIDAIVSMELIPKRELLIVEYCAEELPEGGFRKLSAYCVGGRIVPANSVFDDQWIVKYGKLGSASDSRYASEWDEFNEYPYAKQLSNIFKLGNIEYGRIDFSIVNNNICVYEINTNPNLQFKKESEIEHRNDDRVTLLKAMQRQYVSALMKLDFQGNIPVSI